MPHLGNPASIQRLSWRICHQQHICSLKSRGLLFPTSLRDSVHSLHAPFFLHKLPRRLHVLQKDTHLPDYDGTQDSQSRSQTSPTSSQPSSNNVSSFFSSFKVTSTNSTAAVNTPHVHGWSTTEVSTGSSIVEAAAGQYFDGPTLDLPPTTAQGHPTLKLLLDRWRSQSMPGLRTDGYKLGLVVEGGGMRGIISGAMLMALHQLGMAPVFDAVYGASAGAINSAYFLTGQRHGLSIYTEDLTQNFLDLTGLITGQPVMNLGYLLDHVMHTVKPLDWDGVLTSPVPLKIVASSLDTLSSVLLDDFQSVSDLKECMTASATIPEIVGPPRLVRGQRLVDAAVFEPVPVQSAIKDGCTHVLVLCTRPASIHQSRWQKQVKTTVVKALKSTVLNTTYMQDAWRVSVSDSHDDLLVSTLQSCPVSIQKQLGSYVLPVYPAHTSGCHPACTNPRILKQAVSQGLSSVQRLLQPVPGMDEQLRSLAPLV